MNYWSRSAAAALLTGALAASAFAGAVSSGLKAGDHMTAFDVHDVSGPAKGQTLCYV
jgi:hypothetical protein